MASKLQVVAVSAHQATFMARLLSQQSHVHQRKNVGRKLIPAMQEQTEMTGKKPLRIFDLNDPTARVEPAPPKTDGSVNIRLRSGRRRGCGRMESPPGSGEYFILRPRDGHHRRASRDWAFTEGNSLDATGGQNSTVRLVKPKDVAPSWEAIKQACECLRRAEQARGWEAKEGSEAEMAAALDLLGSTMSLMVGSGVDGKAVEARSVWVGGLPHNSCNEGVLRSAFGAERVQSVIVRAKPGATASWALVVLKTQQAAAAVLKTPVAVEDERGVTVELAVRKAAFSAELMKRQSAGLFHVAMAAKHVVATSSAVGKSSPGAGRSQQLKPSSSAVGQSSPGAGRSQQLKPSGQSQQHSKQHSNKQSLMPQPPTRPPQEHLQATVLASKPHIRQPVRAFFAMKSQTVFAVSHI